MKKINCLLVALFLSGIIMAQPPEVPAESGAEFGQKINSGNPISVEQLVANLSTKTEGAKIDVQVKGVVTEVCEAMGCWMKIKNADGSMMVRMKDHAFFVPLAINGKEVIIDGIAEEKVISISMLKHYAEDAGKSQTEIDAIKEAKKEIVIQAKGILVL